LSEHVWLLIDYNFIEIGARLNVLSGFVRRTTSFSKLETLFEYRKLFEISFSQNL